MKKIFIVEDDLNIRELVIYALKNSGFDAQGFPDAVPFYKELEKALPDLIILDIMLEGEDGFAILQTLKSRAETKPIPVIMLTAKTGEMDKVKGLDLGADDYITKPFGVLEMISRVKACLRRVDEETETVMLAVGEIQMDPKKRLVEVSGKPIQLTYKEFELLAYFLANPGIVLSRDQLMNKVWSYDYSGETRTVDVHIRTLRQKLGRARSQIVTVRNVGYKLV